MNIVQGFVKIPELADNKPGAVALFGELSPISMTFSRDLKNYAHTELYPLVEVVTFYTRDETGKTIDLPAVVSRAATGVGDWIYRQSRSGLVPDNAQKATFIQSIVFEFSNLTNSYGLPTKIKDVNLGTLMDTTEVNRRLPDYVVFKLDDDAKSYEVKLWFNDQAFQLQYLYYDMVVLPPLGQVDALNGTTADVSILINGVSKTQIINQTNQVTQNNPATTVYPLTLRWHNPTNPSSTLQTEWFVVIYGKAGIDNDAVKDAIRSYIAKNTGINIWSSIYPDLYAESEFVIVPFWDQLSTPENGYDEGLYRTAVSKASLARIENDKLPASYNTVADFGAYKNLYLVTASSSYRAIMFYALGNPNNTGGYFSFLHVFPDYMNLATTSPDFSRLTMKTQTFMIKLHEAMHKAREYTQSKPLPQGYSMSIKSNREYIGFDYEGFTFYIQTRTGYLKSN